MSLFHRTLRSLLHPHIREVDAIRILDEHLTALNEEFHLERQVIQELREYYELLKNVRRLLRPDGVLHSSLDTDNKYYEMLRRAHTLIIDIEHKIAREYGEAHEFLK